MSEPLNNIDFVHMINTQMDVISNLEKEIKELKEIIKELEVESVYYNPELNEIWVMEFRGIIIRIMDESPQWIYLGEL